MLKTCENKQIQAAPVAKDARLKPDVVLTPGQCPRCGGKLEGRFVPATDANGVTASTLMAWCVACDAATWPNG